MPSSACGTGAEIYPLSLHDALPIWDRKRMSDSQLFSRRRQRQPTLNRGRCLERSEEHTSELQSLKHLGCRLLLVGQGPRSTLFPYTTLFRSGTENGCRIVNCFHVGDNGSPH